MKKLLLILTFCLPLFVFGQMYHITSYTGEIYKTSIISPTDTFKCEYTLTVTNKRIAFNKNDDTKNSIILVDTVAYIGSDKRIYKCHDSLGERITFLIEKKEDGFIIHQSNKMGKIKYKAEKYKNEYYW